MEGGGQPPEPPRTPPAPERVGLLLRLRDVWAEWRNRRIADPAFQAWCARMPFLGPFTRTKAQRLFDLTAGFVYAQTLRACTELDLFEKLADGPRRAQDVASEIDLSPEAAERLMAAAASIGLLERRGAGRFGLGELGAAMRGAPGVAEMVRHHDVLYRDLADPVALLRGQTTPELARFWGYVGGVRTHELATHETAPYTRLMGATQAMVAAEVVAAYDFRRHRHLVDVGGGDGSFLRAVAGQAPKLQLTVFDLPAVAAEAESRFAEAGLSHRARAVGGDFFSDPLPDGADAVSLVRVIYDHDDDAAVRLLARVRKLLPPDGRLLLAEPMAETPGVPRVGDAYFGFYILAMTHGRPRSAGRLGEMLREAGFSSVRSVATARPFLTGLLVATP